MYAINVERTPTQKPRNFRAHFERPRNPRPCHRIGGIANHLTLTDAAAVADDPCHDDPEVAAAEHGDRGHGHHRGDRREPVSAPLSCNPPVPPGSRKPAASRSKTSIESSSLLNPCVRNILLPEMPITLIADANHSYRGLSLPAKERAILAHNASHLRKPLRPDLNVPDSAPLHLQAPQKGAYTRHVWSLTGLTGRCTPGRH
jgi:hypothetical protein